MKPRGEVKRQPAGDVQTLVDDEIVIFPEQLITPTRNKLGGSRLLMAAVLRDGIETFLGSYPTTGRSKRRLYHETAAWVFSDDSSWPFSFMSLCDALEIDIENLRAGLLRWKSPRSLEHPNGFRRRPLRSGLIAAA